MKHRYFTVDSDVIADEHLSRFAKLLYCAIRRFGNRKGECYPGRTKLATLGFMSLTSYKRAAKELIEHGYLKRISRKRPNGSQTTNLFVTSAVHKNGFICVPLSLFDNPLSGNAILTLIVLVHIKGKKHYCCPPQKLMAKLTGMCVTSLRAAIKELMSALFIRTARRSRDNGGNATLCYILNIDFVTPEGTVRLTAVSVSVDELANLFKNFILEDYLPHAYTWTGTIRKYGPEKNYT